MDGQDIAKKKGHIECILGHAKENYILALQCCSIRWKSAEEMLWQTQRERGGGSPQHRPHATCAIVQVVGHLFMDCLHVPNSFHFV
jgi:hypothetical protein